MAIGLENGEQIKVNTRVRPELPTSDEVNRHCAACHVPFRTWCSHCVRGKSDNTAHKNIKDSEETVPTVSMDYCYMTSRDGGGEEDEESQTLYWL